MGVDLPTDQLLNDFDAICLACGSTQPRDLPVPGRELNGVHFAMEYLTQQNRLNAGQLVEVGDRLTAEGKRVVILGRRRYRRGLPGHRAPAGGRAGQPV